MPARSLSPVPSGRGSDRGRAERARFEDDVVAIVRRSPCPVVVVSRRSPLSGWMGERRDSGGSVVCGIDGSEESFGAASLASDLASRLDVRLVLAHVMPEEQRSAPVPDVAALETDRRNALELLRRAVSLVSHRLTPELRLEHGDPAACLEELAIRESARLLVVASRGMGRFRPSLGSTAARLTAGAAAPVVVLAPHVVLAAGSGEYELEDAGL